MKGQAGAGAVGQEAVSWMPDQAGAGGAPGQSMRDQGAAGGPGAPGVSQMGGAIAAPGIGAQSMLDGTVQAAAPGQSVKGEAGGPGAPGQSMKGEAGGPGAPGQSMKDAGAAGGPGAPPSAAEAGSAGGPGAAPAGKAKTEAELVAGEKKDPKAEATLTTDKKDPKAAAELKAGEAAAKKDDAGSSGGPGAAKGASGAPGKAKDDDLVDPDADRPNFGAGADEDEEAAEGEDEEDAFSSVASRAGKNAKQAKKLKERKPLDPAYVTVGVMMLAVAALGVLVYAGRGIMMQMWPQIAGFYDKMGMEAPPKEGEGLKIALSPMSLRRIGGVETLVVRGFISNIGEIPRAVPKLKLELYNEKKEVLQDAPGAAPTALLDPKGSVEFEIRMELPQIAAAKGGYAVVWAK